ncbi:MAG: hypothetical protein QXP22_02760 [Candidatus Anstonellales archaeon]
MNVIGKIKKRKDASYVINSSGDIIEERVIVKIVGKIKRKEGKEYVIQKNGDIVEKDVMNLTFDEYNKLKASGKLAEEIKKGKIIKIVYEDLPISALQKIEEHYIKEQILGATILGTEIINNSDGTREMRIKLDNKKTIVLREGLLVQGSVIEIE